MKSKTCSSLSPILNNCLNFLTRGLTTICFWVLFLNSSSLSSTFATWNLRQMYETVSYSLLLIPFHLQRFKINLSSECVVSLLISALCAFIFLSSSFWQNSHFSKLKRQLFCCCCCCWCCLLVKVSSEGLFDSDWLNADGHGHHHFVLCRHWCLFTGSSKTSIHGLCIFLFFFLLSSTFFCSYCISRP